MKRQLRYLLKVKSILIIGFFSVLFIVLFGYISNKLVVNTAESRTFDNVEQIRSNTVGLVLGTAKYRSTGGINLYFKYRVEAAVKLFKSGKVNFILVSGDNSTKYYNEPEAFKEELIKRGVPANKIYLDYAGFRTLDSVVRSLKVFGQSSITIISQKFHNERAIYLATKNGIDAVGFNAQDVNHNYGFKTKVREYFARSKAILDIIFGVNPKFLGEPIHIK